MAECAITQGDRAMHKLALKGRGIMAFEAETGAVIPEQGLER